MMLVWLPDYGKCRKSSLGRQQVPPCPCSHDVSMHLSHATCGRMQHPGMTTLTTLCSIDKGGHACPRLPVRPAQAGGEVEAEVEAEAIVPHTKTTNTLKPWRYINSLQAILNTAFVATNTTSSNSLLKIAPASGC